MEIARLAAAERGWSHEQWALHAGSTLRTLQQFLRGDPRLKWNTIELLLQPLGLRAADIVVLPASAVRALIQRSRLDIATSSDALQDHMPITGMIGGSR